MLKIVHVESEDDSLRIHNGTDTILNVDLVHDSKHDIRAKIVQMLISLGYEMQAEVWLDES